MAHIRVASIHSMIRTRGIGDLSRGQEAKNMTAAEVCGDWIGKGSPSGCPWLGLETWEGRHTGSCPNHGGAKDRFSFRPH